MIITKSDLSNLNLNGKVVGITSGCFDLLHFYHLRYLERCKAFCDILIVGVDSDLLVSQNKNKVPVIPEHHRMAMVDALKCVDATFRMDQISDIDDYAKLVSADMMFKNQPVIYGNEVKTPDGIKLVLIPDIEEISSTTGLINKIQSGVVKKEYVGAGESVECLSEDDTTDEETPPETVGDVKEKEDKIYYVRYFYDTYPIKVGSTIMFDTPFGERFRTVTDIVEYYNEETRETELEIHTDKGSVYKTYYLRLMVPTSGCNGFITN